MSTNEGRKRKREPDTLGVSPPLVAYRGSPSLGTFIRPLEEDSLAELHTLIRNELGLPAAEPVRLRWKHKIDHIRLENDGDFSSFSRLVYGSKSMVEVEIIEPRTRCPQPAPFPLNVPPALEKWAGTPEDVAASVAAPKKEEEAGEILRIDPGPSLAFGPRRYQRAVELKRAKSNPSLSDNPFTPDTKPQEKPMEGKHRAPPPNVIIPSNAKDKGQKKQIDEPNFLASNIPKVTTSTPAAPSQNYLMSHRAPGLLAQTTTPVVPMGIKDKRKQSTGDLSLSRLIPPKTPTPANIVSRVFGPKTFGRPPARSSSAHSESSGTRSTSDEGKAVPPTPNPSETVGDTEDESGSASEADEDIPEMFNQGKILEAQYYIQQCDNCKAHSRECVVSDGRASRAVPACWPCQVTKRSCSFVAANEKVNVKWKKYKIPEHLWVRAKQNKGHWPLVREISSKGE